MTKFKIGDRVKFISQLKINEHKLFNKVGTVKNLNDDFSYSVGVEFDDEVQGHTCDGSCKQGHGLWLSSKMLKKIEGTIYAKDKLQSISDFYKYAKKIKMENAPVAFVIGDKQIVFDKKDLNSNYVYGESKSSLIDGVALHKHERFIINLKDKD